VITGEEDEEAVFSVRAKLYVLSDQKQWKERGTGPLKLNVRKDGETARISMCFEFIASSHFSHQ
jgi:Ran-binding protein 3